MKIAHDFKARRETPATLDDVYYPLVWSPFGKIPLMGATMTDEKEREIAKRHPAQEGIA